MAESNEGDNVVASKPFALGGGNGGGSDGTDLALSMAADKGSVGLWENIGYSLTLTNEGNQEATNVVVDFQKPSNTAFVEQTISQGSYSDWNGKWFVGTVPAGATLTLDVTYFTLQFDNSIVAYAQVESMDQTDADSSPNNNAGPVASEDDERI